MITTTFAGNVVMELPLVTISGVDKLKISDEPGFDISTVTFSFNHDVEEYKVVKNGVSHDTGKVLIHEVDGVPADVDIEANIHASELQEGDNRINIYGKNPSGWTPYSG